MKKSEQRSCTANLNLKMRLSMYIHSHDRNMLINKMVKEKGDVTNQNDSWHGVKSIKRALKAISPGPKYKVGKA